MIDAELSRVTAGCAGLHVGMGVRGQDAKTHLPAMAGKCVCRGGVRCWLLFVATGNHHQDQRRQDQDRTDSGNGRIDLVAQRREHALGQSLVVAAGDEQRHHSFIQRGDEGEQCRRDHTGLDLRQGHGHEGAKAVHAQAARHHFLGHVEVTQTGQQRDDHVGQGEHDVRQHQAGQRADQADPGVNEEHAGGDQDDGHHHRQQQDDLQRTHHLQAGVVDGVGGRHTNRQADGHGEKCRDQTDPRRRHPLHAVEERLVPVEGPLLGRELQEARLGERHGYHDQHRDDQVQQDRRDQHREQHVGQAKVTQVGKQVHLARSQDAFDGDEAIDAPEDQEHHKQQHQADCAGCAPGVIELDVALHQHRHQDRAATAEQFRGDEEA